MDNERDGLQDYMTNFDQYQHETNEKKNMKNKQYLDELKHQILENAASKQAEQQKMKAPSLATLVTRKAGPDLEDCDRCHRPYPRFRLTSKKSLNLKKKKYFL